jgi:hypothetical protein
MNLYKVNGYGLTFDVKAATEKAAVSRIHYWAIGEGLLRSSVWAALIKKIS